MFAIGSKLWPGLSKLAEESGEVVQVIGKLMGTAGHVMHWDNSNLRVRLIEEMADLLAACDFVIQHNSLDEIEIKRRRAEKLALFNEWHMKGDPLSVIPKIPCTRCHGKGMVLILSTHIHGAHPGKTEHTCSQCKGRGCI